MAIDQPGPDRPKLTRPPLPNGPCPECGGLMVWQGTEQTCPIDHRIPCVTCGGIGFGPSQLGPDRCQFCDGTEGGNPPSIAEILEATHHGPDDGNGLAAAVPVAGMAGDVPTFHDDAGTPEVAETSGEESPRLAATGQADLRRLATVIGANFGNYENIMTEPITREVDVDPDHPEADLRPNDPDLLDPLGDPGGGPGDPGDLSIPGDAGDGDDDSDPDSAAYKAEQARRAAGPPDEPQFLYLAGTAGTGKSYQARQRADEYDDAVLTASTGIAAVNIGGTTINSVLGYYDTDSMQTEYEFGRINARLSNLAKSGFLRLIVDEVSMMDGRQLDILCLAIDEVNEHLRSDLPRPLGLTLVGDFAQLPPVKAQFVFERPSWSRFEPYTTMLTEPRRQADPEFVRALQAVRRGDRKAALEYFRPFLYPAEDRKFNGTSILAKNTEVDRYNLIRMLDLPGPEHTFAATRIGEQASEWKHIPDLLRLKPNCLVMVLANRKDPGTTHIIYANGDLAHYVRPQIPDNPMSAAVVRLLRNGVEVVVDRVTREKKVATGAKGVKKDKEDTHGSIVYLPLRVAYGSTVHKSQGLSLDNVQVMINSQFFMTSGMLYVALSRARTPGGLRIVGSAQQFEARVRMNPLIQRWL